jgi:hypothetical protein
VSRAPLRRATRWTSLGLLLLAAGLLTYGLGGAIIYTATHAGPPCANPPSVQASPPQLVVVAFCVAGFVLGHLTARWQHVEPRHLVPPALPAAVGPGFQALLRRRGRQLLLVQALLLVFLLEVAGLLLYELVALSSNRWPVTFYVWCAYDAAGWPTTLAASSICFLLGRWLWPPRYRRAHAGA